MKIEYTENITQELEDVIYGGFGKEGEKNNTEVNFKQFAFVIKDEEGKIFGGLVGNTLYGEVHIGDLFIEDSLRDKGYGLALISEVENFFKGKGYDNMNLATHEFQAPKFYEKCGFELEFIRKNEKNPKLDKYFFVKKF